MKHFAAVKKGVVMNIALWDSKADWHPGDDFEVVECEGTNAGIGWTFDGTRFHPPVTVEVAEVVDGIVVDVHGHDGKPLPRVSGAITYVECTGQQVSPGWTYNGSKFAPKE